MAHDEKGNRNQHDARRRSILQAGVVALGGALLPRVADATAPALTPRARGELVEQLRVDYMRRVQELAERLRPDLADVRDSDGDELEEPCQWLENECRPVLCANEQDARLVFALSPNWEEDAGADFVDVRNGAAIIVALDVATVIGAAWFWHWHTFTPFPKSK